MLVDCPHCKYSQEFYVSGKDLEDTSHEIECRECEKTYTIKTFIGFYFEQEL